MAFLLNIYKTGVIVETHVIETREEGETIYADFLNSQEDDYEKSVCFNSLTFHEDLELPTETELTKTNDKKPKK